MRRTGYAGPYLLVEGDADSRFWRKHTRVEAREIITCSGRTNSKAAIKLVEDKALGPALCILDDDYESLLSGAPGSPNIVLTDYRDLESTLLSSSALEAVIQELGDAHKIEAFEALARVSVRAAFVERCLPFGMARYVSILDGHHVNFTRFPPARYLAANWSIRMCDFKTDFATSIGCSVADLDARFATLRAINPWRLIQGHDALQVLRAGLGEALGSVNIGHDLLCAFLRSAYDTDALKVTPLWGRITRWESNNAVKLLSA